MADLVIEKMPDQLPIRKNEAGGHQDNSSLIYADQVTSLGIGPFVSRMTLGIERGGTIIPTLTLVLPTNIFHQIANQILGALSNPEIQNHLAENLDKFEKGLKQNSLDAGSRPA